VVQITDPASFTVLGPIYAKDRSSAYFIASTSPKCIFTVIHGADVRSFHAVTKNGNGYMNYAADRAHVYNNGLIIPNMDPASFDPATYR
jgi:hypothetical protein